MFYKNDIQFYVQGKLLDWINNIDHYSIGLTTVNVINHIHCHFQHILFGSAYEMFAIYFKEYNQADSNCGKC